MNNYNSYENKRRLYERLCQACANGSLEEVKELIKINAHKFVDGGVWGYAYNKNFLAFAVENNQMEIVKYITEELKINCYYGIHIIDNCYGHEIKSCLELAPNKEMFDYLFKNIDNIHYLNYCFYPAELDCFDEDDIKLHKSKIHYHKK